MNAEVCNRISDLPGQFIGDAEIDARQHSRFELDGFAPKPNAHFQHILVATDFSVSANKAVRLAADLASRSHASLTVLHVVDSNPASAPAHAGSADALMNDSWQNALTQMLHLKGQFSGQNVTTETLIVEGIPWEQIVMQSQGFDLLVLGRTSLPRSWKFFSKRTSRRVLKEVGCPVLST